VVLAVVDSFSKKNTIASIGSLKTLEGLAVKNKYVLPVMAFENMPTKAELFTVNNIETNIENADNKLLSKLSLILPFLTKHDDLEVSDLLSLFNPERGNSLKISNGTKKLDIALNGDYYLSENVVSVKSISPLGHNYRPKFHNLSDFKVDKPNSYANDIINHFISNTKDSNVAFPLEIILADLGFGGLVRTLEEKLVNFNEAEQARTDTNNAIDIDLEASEDGMFF